ncbi:MAG: TIGR04076 family protein [Firmicutes bacterium]|nr:TIGR04076 family protein [Bacillota bacterium]
MNDVRVEVVEVKGDCSAGLKVGDGFTLRDGVLIEPNGPLCVYAVAALSNYLTSISFERPDSGWITGVDRLQCPDPMNTVAFRVIRVNRE